MPREEEEKNNSIRLSDEEKPFVVQRLPGACVNCAIPFVHWQIVILITSHTNTQRAWHDCKPENSPQQNPRISSG